MGRDGDPANHRRGHVQGGATSTREWQTEISNEHDIEVPAQWSPTVWYVWPHVAWILYDETRGTGEVLRLYVQISGATTMGLEKCPTNYIPTERFEEAVWDVIAGWIVDDEKIDRFHEQRRAQIQQKPNDSELEILRARYEELNREEDALIERLVKEANARLRQKLGERLDKLAAEIDQVKNEDKLHGSGRRDGSHRGGPWHNCMDSQ